MEKYLKVTKEALRAVSQNIHAVLGNSSCDLDSAVCALVYGFFQHGQYDSSVELHIPVLNIRRADYSLRTDVTHVLGRCGLSDSSLLTFRDDIDLHLLHSNGGLKLTLVDCHMLSREDSVLDDAVVEVIDHRPRARPDQKGVKTTIELVGSCCTLVTEKLLEAAFNVPEQVCEMLYSTIILDTVCLSESAGRKTPKDEAIIAKLQALQPSLDRHRIFNELLAIKHNDTANLTTLELLRRDVKVVSNGTFSIAVSAVVTEMQTFLCRKDLASDLKTFASEKSAMALLLMFLHTVPNTDNIVRELAVYSTHRSLHQQICQVLCDSTDPPLSLKVVESSGLKEHLTVFNQENVKASRKAVLPIIQNNLEKLQNFVE